MENAIAKLDLILEKPSGERFPVSIRIESPYEIKDGKGSDFAKCPVSMKGFHNRISDVAGEDTFQSLTLAISFVQNMLTYFIEKGGKIFFSDGKTKFEFEPYFKGFEH
jgi:hypothetical protein